MTSWLLFFVRFGLAAGLAVVCATSVKRVGGGAWLLGAFAAIDALFMLIYRVMGFIQLENESQTYTILRIVDSGFTAIGAVLAFVGLALLRR